MLDPLVSLLGSIGHALGTYSMARLLGDFVARVIDDFKRNRATARRLKQAADDESKKGQH